MCCARRPHCRMESLGLGRCLWVHNACAMETKGLTCPPLVLLGLTPCNGPSRGTSLLSVSLPFSVRSCSLPRDGSLSDADTRTAGRHGGSGIFCMTWNFNFDSFPLSFSLLNASVQVCFLSTCVLLAMLELLFDTSPASCSQLVNAIFRPLMMHFFITKKVSRGHQPSLSFATSYSRHSTDKIFLGMNPITNCHEETDRSIRHALCCEMRFLCIR